MSYLLIYLWTSLVMSYLLFKAFKGFFESHNDILKSPYPTAEAIVTLVLFYLIWPAIIAVHLYLFFTRHTLVSLTLKFDLKRWIIIPTLLYDMYSPISNEYNKVYSFLFISVYYSYNKKKKR